MLSDLPVLTDARILVDHQTADDAGVFALNGEHALVQTVDFFTPIVDDPFVYGEIAAANAVSDVYAMGGTPITALAIAGIPVRGLEVGTIKAIFRGGCAKLLEAGVALLGGHTVQDQEVKFGYAVTGLVDRQRVWRNSTAREGDALLLTKALGTGIITTALKFGDASADAVDAAVQSMRTLNKATIELLRKAADGTVSACTDVTGFGLIGHASEMAAASRVTLTIETDAVPLLPRVLELARRHQTAGGASNARDFGYRTGWSRPVDDLLRAVLFDPQTSGGLLVAVAQKQAAELRSSLEAHGVGARLVGEVVPSDSASRVILR